MAMSSEGGAGGKFRKKPLRRSPTKPYDRPLNATRGNSSRGWFSKIVDPASKLITLGANCLFDSVFRKHLTANSRVLSLDQDLKQDSHDALAEAAPRDSAVAQVSENVQAGGTSNVRGSTITELEEMLKQKTLTRSEIDSLTQLVRARTFDAPSDHKGKTPENNSPKLAADMQRVHFVSTLNENVDRSLQGRASMPSTSRIFEDDIASPAELAKAYMGSRSTRLSPSALGFRPYPLKQEAPLASTSVFHPKSAIAPDLKPKVRSLGPDINFLSPRSDGQSVMYARTPYSRSHFPNGHKSLKRRYSVLDDDIGAIHPISRLAKKPNLLPSKVNGFPLSVSGSKHTPQKQDENSSTDMGLMSVPSKSSQTAAKIFQHLETLVSPKSRSAEAKLADVKGKSPMVLTENMLNGKALKSLQDIESPSKACQDLDLKIKDGSLSSAFDKKSDKVQGHELVVVGQKDKNFPAPGSSSAGLFESKIPSNKNDLILPSVYPNYVKKKRGFVMSAHEDYPDTEDDTSDANINSLPGKLPDSKEKANVTLESKNLTAENDKTVMPSICSSENIAGDESVRKTEETSRTCLAVGNGNGFSLPTVTTSATTGKTFLCDPTMPPVSKISSFSSEVVAPDPTFQSPSSTPASGLHISATIHSPRYPKIETSSRNGEKEVDVRDNGDVKSNHKVEMMKMPSVELSTVKPEASSPVPAVFSFPASNPNEKPPLFPSKFSSSTASSSVPSVATASTSPLFATSGGGAISSPSTSALPAFVLGSTTPIPSTTTSTSPLLKPLSTAIPDSNPCKTSTEPEPSMSSSAMSIPPDSGAKSDSLSVGSGLAVFSQSKPSLPCSLPGSSSPASIFGSTGSGFGTSVFTFGGQSSGGSTSTPAFAFGSSSASASGSTLFGSTTTTPAPTWPTSFSFGNTSASSSIPLPATSPASQSTTFSLGPSSTAASASSGSPFSFSSPSMASSTTSGPGFLFSAGAASSPMSTATLFSPAAPTFGNFSNPSGFNPFQSSGNTDGMNADDTMAEDTVQHVSTPSGFTPPSFAFGTQPAFPTFGQPAQPALFGSPLDTNAIAGSFSFGANGVDKSNRKIVRVKHKPRRK